MLRRLVVSLSLSCLIVSCSNSGAKTDEQDTAPPAADSQDSTAAVTSPTLQLNEDTCADGLTGCDKEIDKIENELRLSAELADGEITSAKLDVLKDGEIDQEATGQAIFRLFRIDSLEGTVTLLDPTSRVCNEGEDEDIDECNQAYECDEDDCPITKTVVKGEAVLFDEQMPYPAGDAIATDGVEIQAGYGTRTTKGRFKGFEQ